MFEPELKELELKLKVPYPERVHFLNELTADLSHSFRKSIEEGVTHTEARARALEALHLSGDDIESLNIVHESRASRCLAKLPAPIAQHISDFSGIVPLVIFAIYATKEFPMLEFLREGGLPGVLAIIIIGGIGIAINFRHLFKWFVLRDHSTESLRAFNNGPLYLAVASLLIGIFSTAAGYRIVFAKWSEGSLPDAVVRAGLSEPLAGLMVATIVAGLIVLLHGWLATWRTQTIAEQV
jgi:hypothetical protein